MPPLVGLTRKNAKQARMHKIRAAAVGRPGLLVPQGLSTAAARHRVDAPEAAPKASKEPLAVPRHFGGVPKASTCEPLQINFL